MCCSPTPHGCASRICAIWAGFPLRSSWWRSGVAVLALALLAYLAALAVHGNGFVADLCGGIAFGAAAGRRGAAELAFLEQTGSAVSLLVWLAFGAIAVPIALDHIGWAVV